MKKPKERRSGLAAGLLLLLLPGASPADPPVVAEWRAVPEFSDEFSGPSLDAAKWHSTNPEWKGRKPGLFLPRNVRVKDGMLELTVKAETVPEMTAGYHSFTCASVKSMHRIRYGWFEIRARTGNSAASSAFWLYHQTPNLWTELDVFEITGKGKFRGKLHSNTPVLREPGLAEPLDFHEEWKLPWDPAAGFHRYALVCRRETSQGSREYAPQMAAPCHAGLRDHAGMVRAAGPGGPARGFPGGLCEGVAAARGALSGAARLRHG